MIAYKHALACFSFAIGTTLSPMTHAQPSVVSGITFDNPINVQNVSLGINGTGMRYKAMFKVYAAALYTPNRASTPEEVINQDGPKRLRLVMLRSVAADELGKLFTKGISENIEKSQFAKLAPSVFTMGSVFAQYRELVPGDTIDIDWIPGSGTVIRVRGQVAQTFPDPVFYQAMMRIWLGNSPADWKLKDALLGKAG